MGRPLVATDVPGCRDVVDDGVNGFLCEPNDPVSLAEAMERLGNLPEQQRASMGAASRRKVQEQFSEALVIRAYLDALADLERN
jgi:glycosyltransferase involved in cell wall biosynthesis